MAVHCELSMLAIANAAERHLTLLSNASDMNDLFSKRVPKRPSQIFQVQCPWAWHYHIDVQDDICHILFFYLIKSSCAVGR
jgi:hypothetical protein